ncbi:Ku protein (plasmid) [Rhizobium sp. C104]|uniref:non-homologous end joining protein Ku n=1 Tax=Rhizobium sp. C104 TaxID=2917727 RepID=UPI001EF90BDE|nr:Ku protein [Rhizobium sp. C104]ULJ81250.1 Ku protein [Rhizobium sp. C104]
MAPRRPYWKGYLKLSLVTCPVAMSPAISESEKVRFHTLNKETGNRVLSRYVNSVTGKPVKDENEAKGYERGENDYVLLTDEDLESVDLETVRTIDIEKFVPRESIEWIYLETPHYLVPNDKIGNEAFAVIRDAMKAENVLGVSRVVIGRRERAVILEPRDQGIVVWTLRFGDEVRPEEDYFHGIEKKADTSTVSAITQIIKRHMDEWSPSMVSDPIQESLLKLIATKKKALKPSKSSKAAKDKKDEAAKPSNVISIMDALKKSVEADLKGRRKAGR